MINQLDFSAVYAVNQYYSKFKQLETYNTTFLWNVKTFLQHLA